MAERTPTSIQDRRTLKLLQSERIETICPIVGCRCIITDRAGYGICRFAPQSWNYIDPATVSIGQVAKYAVKFREQSRKPGREQCAFSKLNSVDLVQGLLGIILARKGKRITPIIGTRNFPSWFHPADDEYRGPGIPWTL